jgi:hypothetical protein
MRKDGWTYITTGLPDDSQALADLQRLADELGVTKAEANRLLLIAYSKASHGEWGHLWGFSMAPVITSPHLVQNGKADTRSSELQQRRRRSAAAASIALDLED